MKRKTISSSNIKSIGYNVEYKILEIEFHSKAVYGYLNVDSKTVVELLLADSVGKYFASNVKNKFKCVKGEYSEEYSG